MDIDEDDDFYAPEESAPVSVEPPKKVDEAATTSNADKEDEDLEEGEEEDEDESGSDSDIDIITERKDGSKAPPPTQARYNDIRSLPPRTSTNEVVSKPAPKKEASKATPQPSGADLPGIATSKIDVNAKPVYEPAGKPITLVDIDEDLPGNDKPWRRPGTDVSDYFNYGFDEFTWALYASKQETLRSEYNQDKIAQNNKKMFEDMNMMMAMGAMPGMAGGAAMPGMEGMGPEMQQAMMQQMMASGMDPSQMDPATMFAAMQGQAGAASGAGAANQGQGFGGPGFGQGQYGYDQGNETRRGNFGKGRGGRRGGW